MNPFSKLALLAGLLLSTAAPAQVPDDIATRTAACIACHGKEGRAAADGYYPRIAGKPAGYLFNQLQNFRDGRRQQYPLMTYMVDHMPDAYLQEIASHFAGQHPPYPPPQPVTVSPATLERGRVLVMKGDVARKIPACIACHGNGMTGVDPAVPGLLGVPKDYINAQFGAWRNGVRKTPAPDCMGRIANLLSLEDINAASAWLAAQPVPADTRPAAPATARLPMDCGSVPH